jgi:hypothetical protein
VLILAGNDGIMAGKCKCECGEEEMKKNLREFAIGTASPNSNGTPLLNQSGNEWDKIIITHTHRYITTQYVC